MQRQTDIKDLSGLYPIQEDKPIPENWNARSILDKYAVFGKFKLSKLFSHAIIKKLCALF